MDLYKKAFENNQAWIKNTKAGNKDFFAHLAKGQDPEILYIGCSDSRVSPEQMMGMQPGQMFVHRNVGNLVPNNDHNSESVLDYAIGHLRIKHIVVCGHYLCGAVKAAMSNSDTGALDPWLKNIRDVARIHQQELGEILDQEKKYERLVELNVIEQCLNVLNMSVVKKHRQEDNTPQVHGWVFDIKSGKLIELDIDFEKERLLKTEAEILKKECKI